MLCLRAVQRLKPIIRLSKDARVTFCTSIGLSKSAISQRNAFTLLRSQAPCTVVQTRGLEWKNDISKLPRSHPEHGDLAYVGTISNMVKFVKTFSLSTSIIGLAFQPIVYQSMEKLPLWLRAILTGGVSFFIFVTPLLIHFITSRYVLHLYYRPDTGVFTASTYNLFVREKQIQFTAADVEFPEIHGILSTLTVKGKPLFVDPSQFLDRRVYIKLMSYDKPMDWEADKKVPKTEDASGMSTTRPQISDSIKIPTEHLQGLKGIQKDNRKTL